MDSPYTYTITGPGKSKDIDGTSYAVEANGGLTVRNDQADGKGGVVVQFASGQWHSIETEENDPAKPKAKASNKAEKDAANLTDDQREVQDMQTLAQSENPYTSKVDYDALANANNAASSNQGEKDTNTNPPNADKLKRK